MTVRILDRDGFVVRTIASGGEITPGKVGYTWDGRDDSGQVVTDEAYSLRIVLNTPDSTAD